MTYVAWLRLRRCVTIVAIVLGALVVLAGILRVSFLGFAPLSSLPMVRDSALGSTPMGLYGAAGILVGLIVATVLGAPFARENDGHLEIAFTTPTPRARLGAELLLVDLVAIAACWALGIVAAIAAQSIFRAPIIGFSGADAIILAISLCGPFAWYAMLCAATASLRRGYYAVLGLSWLASPIVLTIAALDLPGNAVWHAVHGVFLALAAIDPMSYMSLHGHGDIVASGLASLPATLHPLRDLGILALLVIGYSAAAIVQWRRVEA